MVVVIGEFRLPPERLDEARAMMRKVVNATRAEAGCMSYAYGEDVLDPGLIRVSEAWESADHLTAHLATPHMQVWAEERAGLGLSGRQITRYDVSGSQAI